MDLATIVATVTLLVTGFDVGLKYFMKYKKKKDTAKDGEFIADLEKILSSSGQAIKGEYERGFKALGERFANSDRESISPFFMQQ